MMHSAVILQVLDAAVGVFTSSSWLCTFVGNFCAAGPDWWRRVATPRASIDLHCVAPADGKSIAVDAILHSASMEEKLNFACEPELWGWLNWTFQNVLASSLGQRYHLIHAGAIASGRKALLLPAESGAGKSTLTAALVLSGFSYLSDDIAVVDRDTYHIWPFPKPIMLRHPSLPRLDCEFPDWRARRGKQYLFPVVEGVLVSPQGWLPGEPGDGFMVTHIVFPHYQSSCVLSELQPITRGEAFIRLVQQRYGLARRLGFGTFVLAMTELVKKADCYTLTMGSLRSAVACIDRLLAGEQPGGTPVQVDLSAAQAAKQGS